MVGRPDSRNWIGYHEIMGMRTKTAKLVYYPDWKNGPFWEYFDLTQDPREMTNLYHDPQRQAEIQAVQGQVAGVGRPVQGSGFREDQVTAKRVRTAEMAARGKGWFLVSRQGKTRDWLRARAAASDSTAD